MLEKEMKWLSFEKTENQETLGHVYVLFRKRDYFNFIYL